jgi:putative transposase
MPFPVRAVQVDGGSEFMAQFETACKERGIRLFVLPPRSPKLNGHVERAQRTHREEFYRRVLLPDSLKLINRALRRWENVHNSQRPHQALAYRTPKAFLREIAA